MAAFSEANGFVDSGMTAWSFMTEGAAMLGLSAEELPADASVLTAALREGRPVIASVLPGDFTTVGHFIVIAGVDEAGNLIVHDPNSPERSSRSWDVQDVLNQCANLWAYSARQGDIRMNNILPFPNEALILLYELATELAPAAITAAILSRKAKQLPTSATVLAYGTFALYIAAVLHITGAGPFMTGFCEDSEVGTNTISFPSSTGQTQPSFCSTQRFSFPLDAFSARLSAEERRMTSLRKSEQGPASERQ